MNIFSGLDAQSIAINVVIGQMAQDHQMKAYLVGGPVRDLLLKRPNLDLDISVDGNGMVLAKMFALASRAKVVCYPAFKTATVTLPEGRLVDFVTARKETYARPGAFPAVVPSHIKNDLFRRDFTINAIAVAINPRTWGKVIDPFGGTQDVKNKKVRVLHDRSFYDDPTRILRAARFKERFHFSLEQHTLKLLKEALRNEALDAIKPQRYKKEYSKILKEKNPQPALKCLEMWGALKEGACNGAH